MQTKPPSLDLPAVRRAPERDVPALSELLAHAYIGDPLSRWLIPGDEQWTRFAHKYFAFLIRSLGEDGVLLANEDATACALWQRPNPHARGPLGRAWHGVRMMTLLRARSSRGVRLARLLEEHEIHEPHWHLQFLAVDSHQRGERLASSVLRPMLDRCDAEGHAACVESSNAANTPVFQHFGFEVRNKFDLAPRLTISRLWRRPQGRGRLTPL